MLKRISAIRACNLLGKIMNEAGMGNDEYLIERNGEPIATLVPAWMVMKKQKRTYEFLELMGRGSLNAEGEILDPT